MKSAFLALLLVGLSRAAIAQTDALIAVYADPRAESCNVSVPFPGPAVDLYVVFTPGVSADGILSAAFRVDGLPEGWTAEEFLNPNAISQGSLFGTGGAFISFSTCQSDGPVVLYRLRITPTSNVANGSLAIRVGAHPLGVSCPSIEACPPAHHEVLGETAAILNATRPCSPRIGGCPVSDAPPPPPSPPTWSKAKVMYR